MKKIVKIIAACLITAAAALTSCSDYPIDSEGRLISEKTIVGVTNIELLDESHRTVKSGNIVWDTIDNYAATITVFYNTNLKLIKPSCTSYDDCVVEPRMGVWTDFSSLQKKYTIISGNRKNKRELTINIVVAQP